MQQPLVERTGGLTSDCNGRAGRNDSYAALRPARGTMPPVRRRLLDFLTSFLLLPFVVVVALWARSYFVEDFISRESDREEAPGVSVSWTATLTSSWGGVSLLRGILTHTGDPDAVRDLNATVRKRRPLPLYNGWQREEATSYPVPAGAHTAGFAWASEHQDDSFVLGGQKTIRIRGRVWVLILPYWSVAAVTACAAAPAGLKLASRARRRRWLRRGLCPTCGYDLRGTPEKCPECGASRSDDTPLAPEAVGRTAPGD